MIKKSEYHFSAMVSELKTLQIPSFQTIPQIKIAILVTSPNSNDYYSNLLLCCEQQKNHKTLKEDKIDERPESSITTERKAILQGKYVELYTKI